MDTVHTRNIRYHIHVIYVEDCLAHRIYQYRYFYTRLYICSNALDLDSHPTESCTSILLSYPANMLTCRSRLTPCTPYLISHSI